MGKEKVIRDSIHGYIVVKELFVNIIDSPEFQRLKWIEQGSFRILYPSARHDRFIHSLGTYYLASQFASNVMQNIASDIQISIDKEKEDLIINTFLYAALLHDIGHAPFSHTCENYFKLKIAENDMQEIEASLFEILENIVTEKQFETFKNEFQDISPSPHEIASAVILAQKTQDFLGESISKVDIELAIRMVIGNTYKLYRIDNDEEKKEFGIKNCFIRLLNSSTVDVDKLDYITRDTKMSGFNNVSIDIFRLIQSISAVKIQSDIMPAFRKNSLSVIDNVFKAKTEQSQWMVSHPVVVYDSALLQQCIKQCYQNTELQEIFSLKALSIEGQEVRKKKYFLLSDMDILSDLKENFQDSIVKEFFCRNARRHPVWKSFYEYEHYFADIDYKLIMKVFRPLINYMNENDKFVINDKLLSEIIEQNQEQVQKVAMMLKQFSDLVNINFDFVLLEAKNTFAAKIEADKIYITFPNLPSGKSFSKYSELKPNNSEDNDTNKAFFYLYSMSKLTIEQMRKLRELINSTISEIKNRERRA